MAAKWKCLVKLALDRKRTARNVGDRAWSFSTSRTAQPLPAVRGPLPIRACRDAGVRDQGSSTIGAAHVN